ncbi:transporter substrate-binding domain-containing protein [Terasakiella sp. A23]|uniref:substrate-binding periplasmic protein n=1 Tax=Terasakiella sp. FCG-A23 TaxID=3080561 RepID=UPI002952F570|nr:transporter substrate-binding domain-containing protein [Terasakiella sp. A23]MDV7341829.1 transporter substrate-binding domain-containing protein [Terasakiella sp. A23]
MAKLTGILLLIIYHLTLPSHADLSLRISAIENSDNSDISEIVLRKAYEKIGYQLHILSLPAKRSLHHANEGQSDGELFRIDGMEKTFTNLIKVPVAVNQLDAMVMTQKDDFSVKGWDSLNPYLIAIRRGVKFSEIGTKGMSRVYFNSNMGLGRILIQDNNVDIAVIARANGLQTIQHLREVNASQKLHLTEPPIATYPLYHYLHKKHADLVPRLAAVLEEMQANGEMAAIRTKYFKDKYGQ